MEIKTFKPRKLEIPVSEIEQASFCRLDDNLRSKTLEEEFKSGVKWQKVPSSTQSKYAGCILYIVAVKITE